MTMTATILAVTRHDLYVGAALVCPDARYVKVAVPGYEALYRRPASAEDWVAIAAELSGNFSNQLLASSSVLARVICRDDPARYSIRPIAQPLIKSGSSAESDLDQLLRDVVRRDRPPVRPSLPS